MFLQYWLAHLRDLAHIPAHWHKENAAPLLLLSLLQMQQTSCKDKDTNAGLFTLLICEFSGRCTIFTNLEGTTVNCNQDLDCIVLIRKCRKSIPTTK